LKKCKVYAKSGRWVENALLRSIIWSVPQPCNYPCVNFRKTYDEETVREVLELIEREQDLHLI